MERRKLGNTGLTVPILSFGASSLGEEFVPIDLAAGFRAVRVALDGGMDLIDTAPYYGRGMSEVLLGLALKGVPRDSYLLSSKVGRYDAAHFDFSAKRMAESVDVSLHRLRTDHLDLVVCHDIEYVDLDFVVSETLPALRRIQESGKVRFVGVSGYPMRIFRHVLDRTPLDFVLSYNHHTLQNTMLDDLLPYLEGKGAGVLSAAPFAARLLTDAPLPPWHKATPEVRAAAKAAADRCRAAGSSLAKLALQFAVREPRIASCLAGTADPAEVAQWLAWLAEPIDEPLLAEVLEILRPVRNWHHIEGRPENNDGA